MSFEGAADFILTYIIIGERLDYYNAGDEDTSKAISLTVELVKDAIDSQDNGEVAELNPSMYFRGLEGLTAPNKGYIAYLLAISDRSRRAYKAQDWRTFINTENENTFGSLLESYDESQITIRGLWLWATIMTLLGAVCVIVLTALRYREISKAVPDYVTLFIFMLLGTTASVHNIWYAEWPLHDAVRGLVLSNNTDKLERFLGRDAFMGTIMAIKRPDVVFDDHKSCLFALFRKGKVILHRMIMYEEAKKHGVSILFNSYIQPVFRKDAQFRHVSIDEESVVHVEDIISAQDVIVREIPGEYKVGLCKHRGKRKRGNDGGSCGKPYVKKKRIIVHGFQVVIDSRLV